MTVYFADRRFRILGQASTGLPGGLTVVEDTKSEDVDTGVAVFECTIPFNAKTRTQVEAYVEVGNHILRSSDQDNECYTIIDSEVDSEKQEATVYAEDDGMDLLNEVVGAYEADQAYPIDYYIEKYAGNAGFEIGINEAAGLTRKLSWDGEATASARIASVATQFDGCEISFSFQIDGLVIARKFINIYKKRGRDTGITLRLNRDVGRIVVKKSIANLATALRSTGGTPEGQDMPITLDGYVYDDGDFYVENGLLKSRNALKKWDRFLWKRGRTEKNGGHITKQYSYDTTSQQTLCAHSITELKKICDTEVNYEVEIKNLRGAKIGDRVNIVDDAGGLYLSTRLLYLETSMVKKTITATMGEHLLKSSGISQRVDDLAEQFARTSQSVSSTANVAIMTSNSASATATNAHATANSAQATANAANSAASSAQVNVDELTEEVAELWNAVLALEAKTILWQGIAQMSGEDRVNLSAAVSTQINGITLVFSLYADGAALDDEFHFFTVPKGHIGRSAAVTLSDSEFNQISHKRLNIYDTYITGCAANIAAGTGASGITYDNGSYVLRCVYGM